MRGVLKLRNPILINNQTVTEVTYDTEEITAVLFAEADAKCKAAAGRSLSLTPVVEFDFSLHQYIGLAAIAAVNPAYDLSDLERIHGSDIMTVMSIGRNFIMQSEDSSQSTSDEQSETTPELSTQASPTSKESE